MALGTSPRISKAIEDKHNKELKRYKEILEFLKDYEVSILNLNKMYYVNYFNSYNKALMFHKNLAKTQRITSYNQHRNSDLLRS
jgi:hypothetical protein